MNDLLKRLIQDHKNMSQVHHVLKQEMGLFGHTERRPDVVLLLDVMDYLRTYSDGFHHPLEDRVYSEMRLHITEPSLVEVLDHIELQHAWLQVLSRRLEGHLEAIAHGEVTPLARLMNDYQSYINMAEEHIVCENEHLLPAIEHYLKGDALQRILQEVSKTSDPLLGEGSRALFERLFNDILSSREETELVRS